MNDEVDEDSFIPKCFYVIDYSVKSFFPIRPEM